MKSVAIVSTILLSCLLLAGTAAAERTAEVAFHHPTRSDREDLLASERALRPSRDSKLVTDTLAWFSGEGPSWNDEITGTPWERVDLTDQRIHWQVDTLLACAGDSAWLCGDTDIAGSYGSGYDDGWYQMLTSGPISLPAGADSAFLIYDYRLSCEEAENYYDHESWDGYNVRLSVSADPDSFFEILPYKVADDSSYYPRGHFQLTQHEWQSLWCWTIHCDSGGGFSDDNFPDPCAKKVFDLRSYADDVIRIRFTFASDSYVNTADDPSLFGLVLDNILVVEGMDSTTLANLPAALGGDTLFFEDCEGGANQLTPSVPVPTGSLWRLAEGGHTGLYKASDSELLTGNYIAHMNDRLVSPKIARADLAPGPGNLELMYYFKGLLDNLDDVTNEYRLDGGDWQCISTLHETTCYQFSIFDNTQWWRIDLYDDYMYDLTPLINEITEWDTLQVAIRFFSGCLQPDPGKEGLQVDDITLLHYHQGTAPNGAIGGTVSQAKGSIEGAIVTASGEATASDTSDAGGQYLIEDLPPGSYSVTASAPGYLPAGQEDIAVFRQETTTVDFSLILYQLDMSWSTFLGGSDYEYGYDIDVDGSGNAVMTGVTASANFPFTSGAYDTTYGTNSDGFIAKLASSGDTLIWATFLGGSNADHAQGLSIDAAGNIYVTGNTLSGDFPVTGGAFDETHNGGTDFFVTKLNPSAGALIYSTLVGGTGSDQFASLAVDRSGCAYVTGETYSTDFPTTTGAFQEDHNGGSLDGVVFKVNASGSDLDYATYIGGSNYYDRGLGIAVDDYDRAHVTGVTNSTDFPTTPGAFDVSHNGHYDAFVLCLYATGSGLLYGTFLGGALDDYGSDIVLDYANRPCVCGQTFSSDFPVTPGAYDTGWADDFDTFVARLDAFGESLQRCTFLGGTGRENGQGIAVDGTGGFYITGMTTSSDHPVTPGAFDPTHNGAEDVFIAWLDSSLCELKYSTYLGGSNMDAGNGIAIDASGFVYICGTTTSPWFPVTTGAYDTTLTGGQDAFLTRLSGGGTGSIFLYDLGVTAAKLPSNVANDVPLTIDTVFVTNYGIQTAAAGTYQIRMTITDNLGAPVFGPGTQVALFPPPDIMPGETAPVPTDPFACRFTFTEAGEYRFYIWSEWASFDDQNPSNDTLRTAVESGAKSAEYRYPTVFNNPAGQGEMRYHDQGFYGAGETYLRTMTPGEMALVHFTPGDDLYPFNVKKALVMMKKIGQSYDLIVYDSGQEGPGYPLATIPFSTSSSQETTWQEVDLGSVADLQDRSADFWLGLYFGSGTSGEGALAFEGGDPAVGGSWGHSYIYTDTTAKSNNMGIIPLGSDWLISCLIGFGSVRVDTMMVSKSGPPKNAGGNIYLGWEDVSQAVRYYIYRTTAPEPDTSAIYDSTTVSHYTDIDAAGSTTTHYYYWFHAVHQDGQIYDGISNAVGEFDRSLESGVK